MLFHSNIFIFVFLPLSLFVFYLLTDHGHRALAIFWLVLASLAFYAWWYPPFIWILAASIIFNYGAASILWTLDSGAALRRTVLAFAIAGNITALGYFKYAGFLAESLTTIGVANWSPGEIVLPLAISFITFQQIGFLTEAYNRQTKESNLVRYALFVTFFPQLIAGPILRHREIVPQLLLRDHVYRRRAVDLSVGFTFFTIGLLKKVILGDGAGEYVGPAFAAADRGVALTFFEAWGATFAFAFQIYFDFSGYSDMAVGLARMFGVRLPLNFYSPYKARSVIDFWRRWHTTLTRFFRVFVYIPLGGNRRGMLRQYANISLTMLLAGLWHGAGWNFIVWGGVHAVFLVTNHAWRDIRQRTALRSLQSPTWLKAISWLLTFLLVTGAWVFFRAESISGAIRMIDAMLGNNGIVLPEHYAPYFGPLLHSISDIGWRFEGNWRYFRGAEQFAALTAMLFIVATLPNSFEFMIRYRPALNIYSEARLEKHGALRWRPTAPWAVAFGVTLVFSLWNVGSDIEFIYFDF